MKSAISQDTLDEYANKKEDAENIFIAIARTGQIHGFKGFA